MCTPVQSISTCSMFQSRTIASQIKRTDLFRKCSIWTAMIRAASVTLRSAPVIETAARSGKHNVAKASVGDMAIQDMPMILGPNLELYSTSRGVLSNAIALCPEVFIWRPTCCSKNSSTRPKLKTFQSSLGAPSRKSSLEMNNLRAWKGDFGSEFPNFFSLPKFGCKIVFQ